MASPATDYTINGVKIKFPCKAYPSQITMMDKIIKCIERRQNSLLESPTGSGKSLALLCASLAWLLHEKERVKVRQKELCAKAIRALDESTSDEETVEAEGSKVIGNHDEKLPKDEQCLAENQDVSIQQSVTTPLKADTSCSSTDENTSMTADTSNNADDEGKGKQQENNLSEDCDFQAPKKRFRTPTTKTIPEAKKRKHNSDSSVTSDDLLSDKNCDPAWKMELKYEETDHTKLQKLLGEGKKTTKSPKVKSDGAKDEELEILMPKIFFCTRTHKQITQIVRELNKTDYNKIQMCILASREQTCIHGEISKNKNKNEECQKALEGKEGKSCSYYAGASVIETQEQLRDFGFQGAWDIEDLVKLGHKKMACPYYITRNVYKKADIVFCPYNYLIDPIIRSQMDLGISNQIVILDEAHNIEDSSREAASWSVTTESLEEAISDLDYFISRNIQPEQYRFLHSVCIGMHNWVTGKSDELIECEYEKYSKVWDGDELVKVLEDLGFSRDTLSVIVRNFKKVIKPKSEKPRGDDRQMKSNTGALFEGLFMVLGFIFKNDQKFLPDYRIGVIKKSDMVRSEPPVNGWRRKGAMKKKWVFTLHFWCMSPAVAFSQISSESRSVILTSGTLSPMSSFSSELGTKFPIQLEANHVIGTSQVWVGSLSAGPNGYALKATYKSTELFSFQDELGEAILNICQVIPHGVLCFLPSYNLLDKLVKRWKMTRLWRRFQMMKQCFCEPRRGGKEDFNEIMENFYEAIRDSEAEGNESGHSGALFFAVCRGKVSEGLDFADNNARAVITVGIPYPNFKDTQVALKRKYNDKHCAIRGLLNGSSWYEIQAYRALNQALGRCIRHKNDWGAILLIDERFGGQSSRYKNGLSKWLRNKVIHHDNFGAALSSLQHFSKTRLENQVETTTLTSYQSPGNATTQLHGNKKITSSPPDHASTPVTCKIENHEPAIPPELIQTSTPLSSADVHTLDKSNITPIQSRDCKPDAIVEDASEQGCTRQDDKCSLGVIEVKPDPVNLTNRTSQRLKRRPMFKTELVDHDVQQGIAMGTNDPLPVSSEAQGCLKTEVTSPESPLLFVTPPTSFGNDDVMDVKPMNELELQNITGLMESLEDSGSNVEIKKEIVKDDEDKISHCGTRDLLDMIDNTEEKAVVEWNMTCVECSMLFTTSDQKLSKNGQTLMADSFLGSVLINFLPLTKKHKQKVIETRAVVFDDFSKIDGVSPVLLHNEKEPGARLNSVYCEEESCCYIPLRCSRCPYKREKYKSCNIVGVRSLPCGPAGTTSKVWFFRDRVSISSSLCRDTICRTPSE